MDCPEIQELAAFVETQNGSAELLGHVRDCDACQEALEALQEEVLSLQIPLSELWFRYHVSCPQKDALADYVAGKLDREAKEYVKFHVDDLECAFCQGRIGELDAAATADGKKRVTKSRKRVGEATSVLLRDLRDSDRA